MTNQLQDFYINTIAENAGLLESSVERLISAKIIAGYNEYFRNINEIEEAAIEQSTLLKGREFFFLSLKEVAERLETAPENLNKVVGNGTLQIPNAFEENFKTYYALEEKDLALIEKNFQTAWEKTFENEQKEEVEHTFFAPEGAPSREEENEDIPQPAPGPSLEELEKAEKKRRKDFAKQRSEERKLHHKEMGQEKRKRQERLRQEEKNADLQSENVTRRDASSYAQERSGAGWSGTGQAESNVRKPEEDFSTTKYHTSRDGSASPTEKSSNAKHHSDQDKASFTNPQKSSQSMEYYADNSYQIDYTSYQTASFRSAESSFRPSTEPQFQIYSGGLNGLNLPNPSPNTPSKSREEILASVRQDSDAIRGRDETTITYQGQAITSCFIRGGSKDFEFSTVQEMLDSPYRTSSAELYIQTAQGCKIPLSSSEVDDLKKISSPEYLQNHKIEPISSYYKDQMLENNHFYNGMPIVAVERTQYEGSSQETSQFHTPESVNSVYQSLQENGVDDANYKFMLANGETVAVTEETLRNTNFVLPMPYGTSDGYSKEQIADGLSARAEYFKDITGVDDSPFQKSVQQIASGADAESVRAELEPERELAMQESELFGIQSSGAPGNSTVMMMSDSSEDFSNYSAGTDDSISLNQIFHKDRMEGGFAYTVGQVSFQTTFGHGESMHAMRQIGRFTSWATPFAQTRVMTAQQAAKGRMFKSANERGIVKDQLQRCGLNPSILYQRDSHGKIKKKTDADGKRVPKMKASLSGRDVQRIMNSLDQKFAMENVTSVGLSKLNDKELSSLIEKTGIDENLLKTYQKLKKEKSTLDPKLHKKELAELEKTMTSLEKQFASINNAQLSKLSEKELDALVRKAGADKNRAKLYSDMKEYKKFVKDKGRNSIKFQHSLKRVMNGVLSDADFYQGVRLIESYTRLAKYAVATARRKKKALADSLSKHVKPMRAYYNMRSHIKKTVKDVAGKPINAARKKAEQARRNRKLRAHLRSDRRWTKLTGHTKRGLKRELRHKFNESSVGKSVATVRKKLAPAKQAQVKASGTVSKMMDKLLGGVSDVLNLGNVIQKILLGIVGWVVLVSVIILIFCVLIISFFGMGESDSKMSDGKTTLLEKGVEELVQLDNEWLKTLKELPNNSTPKSVTGERQYTMPDPFTGKKTEITSFGSSTYKCYDAWGWDAIFNKENGIDKEALKRVSDHQINEYSNAKAVLATASVYCLMNDVDTSGKDADENYGNFSKVYNMLWHHSHCYASSVSDKLQICPGSNCCHKDYDCRMLSKSGNLAEKSISGVPYYDIFMAQMGKECDITYYCNDESTWNGIKYFEKGSETRPSGKGCCGNNQKVDYEATLYCSWSGKENLNPAPPAEVPKGAKGSFDYHFKKKGDALSSEMDGCKDALIQANSTYFDTSAIKSALNNSITLLKNGNNFVKRTVDNRNYYCGYTPNIQIFAKTDCKNKVDAKDGFFLFDAKYVDPKTGKITPAADGTICTNERISWFYNCQGHEVDGYTLSYCPGHKGCAGHTANYCLGHLNLEIYFCIAGMNDYEQNIKEEHFNLPTVDNLFFTKNKDGDYAPGDTWDYFEKWEGFDEDTQELIAARLEDDWNEAYGIQESSFELENPLR